MANEENLKGKGFESRSTEEVREIARKGGIASGATRRKKRTMKSAAKMLMDMPASKAIAKKMKLLGIAEEDTTYQMAVIVAMVQEAAAGSVPAATFLRDVMGENPQTELRKQELKQRKEEFKHKQEVEAAAAAAAQEQSGSLVDAILEAYEKGREGDDDATE